MNGRKMNRWNEGSVHEEEEENAAKNRELLKFTLFCGTISLLCEL